MGTANDGNGGGITISWRVLAFAPAMVVLFAAALWQSSVGNEILALGCLGLSFSIAMLWVVLAARAAENPESPLRRFIPRLTIFLVLGTAFLGATRWNRDRRITAMEAGFALFYIAAGYLAVRGFGSKRTPPHLTSIAGGKRRPREGQK